MYYVLPASVPYILTGGGAPPPKKKVKQGGQKPPLLSSGYKTRGLLTMFGGQISSVVINP